VDLGGPRNYVLDGGPDPAMGRGTFEEVTLSHLQLPKFSRLFELMIVL